jgi:hypothetical protein
MKILMTLDRLVSTRKTLYLIQMTQDRNTVQDVLLETASGLKKIN